MKGDLSLAYINVKLRKRDYTTQTMRQLSTTLFINVALNIFLSHGMARKSDEGQL